MHNGSTNEGTIFRLKLRNGTKDRENVPKDRQIVLNCQLEFLKVHPPTPPPCPKGTLRKAFACKEESFLWRSVPILGPNENSLDRLCALNLVAKFKTVEIICSLKISRSEKNVFDIWNKTLCWFTFSIRHKLQTSMTLPSVESKIANFTHQTFEIFKFYTFQLV